MLYNPYGNQILHCNADRVNELYINFFLNVVQPYGNQILHSDADKEICPSIDQALYLFNDLFSCYFG